MDIAAKPLLVIEAGRGEQQYWRDIWRYRELIYFLALRDILVRYKQAVVGVGWSVIRPVVTMAALTWVFTRGAQLKTPDPSIPYFLWVFVATLPWQFFTDALTAASNSLVAQTDMIQKTYFPRMIMPVSRIFVSFVDFSIAFSILVVFMVVCHLNRYHFTPDWRIVFIPIFLLMAWGASIGIGLWFASLNVQYRDFTYIVPFLVMLSLYVSPVGLGSADIAGRHPLLRGVYSLNPIVGVIDGFRWCVFGDRAPLLWTSELISLAMIALLMVSGVRYFRRFERTFADII